MYLHFSTLSKSNWGTDYLFLADLVVASAGDDKKISLWRKNGLSMGTIPLAGTDSGDNIEVNDPLLVVSWLRFVMIVSVSVRSFVPLEWKKFLVLLLPPYNGNDWREKKL